MKDRKDVELTYFELLALVKKLRMESNRWWGWGLLIGFLSGTVFGMYYYKTAMGL